MRKLYVKPQSKELGCVSVHFLAGSDDYKDVPGGGSTDKFDAKENAFDGNVWEYEW